ncbi:MAG: SpoVG family protein [Peptococcaceae bacterium]|jgi:stage V sporulation protein G|nr:SpoVG family protein [Peptococcaceae bacterium]
MPKAQTQKPAPVQAASHPPLDYNVKIQSIRPEGTLRGTASVDLNGQFAVRGVKIMNGSNGLFVSMPSYKAGNGTYRDICFPCTTESKAAFDQAVLNAYQQALIQGQEAGQSRKAAPDPFDSPAHAPVMTM